MKVSVQKIDQQELDKRKISSWPIWEKEISRFDWYYDSSEECFLLEGEVEVELENQERVKFGKGDFVTFPKGLRCVWNIKKPVRKHYNFK